MKTVAIIYIILMIIGKVYELFSFGVERKPYSPGLWLFGLIVNLPIYWLLFEIITN